MVYLRKESLLLKSHGVQKALGTNRRDCDSTHQSIVLQRAFCWSVRVCNAAAFAAATWTKYVALFDSKHFARYEFRKTPCRTYHAFFPGDRHPRTYCHPGPERRHADGGKPLSGKLEVLSAVGMVDGAPCGGTGLVPMPRNHI